MKVVEIVGERSVRLVERAQPISHRDIVTVRVDVTPMCKEFDLYRAGRLTHSMGHEAAGVVVDPGASSRVTAGQRVVVMPQYGCGRCRLCVAGEHIHCPDQRDVLAETGSTDGLSTYGEYLLKPDWLLLPVPDDIGLVHASMACCGLGPTFNAMQRMRVTALDTVLVSGCGPVGLGAIVNARVRGARVIAVETNEYRADLARRVGAEEVVDPRSGEAADAVLRLTGGRGVDAAVDTSNAPSAAPLMETVAAPRGRLAFVGWGGTVTLTSPVVKGLEVHGCWHWNHQRDGELMIETIRRSRPLLDAMMTHTFPLSEVRDAFETQLTGNCGKVVLVAAQEDVSR